MTRRRLLVPHVAGLEDPVAEIEPAEVLEDVADLSNRIEARLKARAAGYEP